MGGDGGCCFGEVRDGTTSLIPDHKDKISITKCCKIQITKSTSPTNVLIYVYTVSPSPSNVIICDILTCYIMIQTITKMTTS